MFSDGKKKIYPCLRRDQWIRFLRPVAAWSFGGGNTALPRGDWWSPHGKKIDIQSELQKKYFDITEYDKYAILLKACVNDNLWDQIHDSFTYTCEPRLKRNEGFLAGATCQREFDFHIDLNINVWNHAYQDTAISEIC